MAPLNLDLIALIRECLCNLYRFKQPEDQVTADLKLALHERKAQLEMQGLFSLEGDALTLARAPGTSRWSP